MKLEWNGDEIITEVKARIRAGIMEGANAVATASKELTPVLDGVLRASTTSIDPVDTGNEIVGGVGNNVIYAARQHEELGWKHPRGGQAKYLETAMTQNEDAVRQTLANHIKGNM